ncbi:hypothetical protein T12_8835 [Trichinella patagoniensis]|uniref:Uncharacterized protein n=1 Tax=Trichinella patagoniensis TaxID=990121 RepID=A0A0V0Z8W0_9BILA|nr:hypothetical protein T12_8835 [Trichinella patagoniensis]
MTTVCKSCPADKVVVVEWNDLRICVLNLIMEKHVGRIEKKKKQEEEEEELEWKKIEKVMCIKYDRRWICCGDVDDPNKCKSLLAVVKCVAF